MMNATPLFPSGRGGAAVGLSSRCTKNQGTSFSLARKEQARPSRRPSALAARTAAAFGRRSFAPSAEVCARLHQFPEMVRLIVHVRIALFCSFADRLISRRARRGRRLHAQD